MTQGTLAPPPIARKRELPERASSAIESRTKNATGGVTDAISRKMREDAWFFPKLLVLAVVALPAIYAIGFAIGQESFGVAIAIVPDMLAAIICAWGIMTAVMFLDAEENNS